MISMLVFALIDLFLRYKNRQLKNQNEKQALNQLFSKELLQVKHEVTEQVLKNISIELHDNICQTLTLAVLQLNNIELKNILDPTENIITIRETIRQALGDLRNISHTLNNDYLKNFNIKEVLQILSTQIIKGTGLAIKYEMEPNVKFASKDQEIIIIRIIQELINNSLKHSKASCIELVIENTKEGFSILYFDDGLGFIPEKPITGMGLYSIKHRLDLMKAKWEFKTSPGNGFLLTAIVPVI